jgi:hypothetical protein
VGKLPGPDVAVHPIHQPNVHVKTWATSNLSSNPYNKKKIEEKHRDLDQQEAAAWDTYILFDVQHLQQFRFFLHKVAILCNLHLIALLRNRTSYHSFKQGCGSALI